MRHRLVLCVVVLSLTLSVPTGLAASYKSPSHTSRWTAVSKGPKKTKPQWSRQTGATTGAIAGAAIATTAASDPVLFGDETTESGVDSTNSGLAGAFPFSNNTNGSAETISVYLGGRTRAKRLVAGLYRDNNGHPAALLASGSNTSPVGGTWNTVTIPVTAIASGSRYWVAVLGTGGTLYLRTASKSSCRSENSAQRSLTGLPSTWSTGSTSAACPVSAYISGPATPLASSPTQSIGDSGSVVDPTALLAPSDTAPPSVSGQPIEGQTLTTTNGAWTNLPTSYSYAWQDCDTAGNNCTAISGATSSSYTLSAEDVSHTVRSVVTASNLLGYGTASSDATASVLPLPPANTAAPTVSGATQQGQTLSTTNGSWSNGPTSFEYAWQDCDTAGNNCTNISGATATTYTLAAGDVGHTIKSVVTATNEGGSTSAASAATAVVATLAPPPPPSNTALPVVTGTTTQGQTLSTSNGSWSGSPTSYSYRWRQCDSAGNNCTNISGATATTYTLAAGDVGHTIKSVVSATNAGGSGSATSAQTAAVTSNIPAPPANSTLPAISGTVAQGQALTTSNGSWTNNPSSFAYKWEDCNSSGASCTIISGATSNTYILTTADVGDTIRAIVTATNPGGSGSATSAQTAAVTSSPSSNTNCAGANGSGVVNQSSLDACGFPSMNTTGPAAGTTFTSSTGFTREHARARSTTG